MPDIVSVYTIKKSMERPLMISLLHLDSDKKFLEKTRRYLDKQGIFSICPVLSVQEAFTILKTRKIDAIISGQSEGIELLKALKSWDIALPFIFYTVSAGKEQIIEALNLGADYFLLKGYGSGAKFAQLQQIVEVLATRSETIDKMPNSHKIPDQHQAPVLRVSKEGFLTYANTAADVLLEEWGITTGESMVDPVKETIEKALSNGIPLRTEVEAGGTLFQFKVEPEENKEYVTIYGHDTTEKRNAIELAHANAALIEEIAQRKLAEATTRKTLSMLNAALESTADGILVVDKKGKITSYNRKFVNIWNIPDSILESRKWNSVTDWAKNQLKDPERYLTRIRELSEHPERESFDMLELNDGRIFERYSKPQKIGNAVVGRVWNFRDVTDRRQAEEDLLASLRDKEVMLREIHHRVKNNLQIVSGLLDMTRKRAEDPATSATLIDMMMKINTMAQIHTRLYESKQFNKIDMNTQIRDQISGLSNIYSNKDCEISTTVKTSSIFLSADQAIPCALMINEILSNAYKHAFKGRKRGSIDILAMQENGNMCITILDDGVGISSDIDISQGNSLGFKLFRALIQYQLKGSFMINNDNGTEVSVKFPVQPVSV